MPDYPTWSMLVDFDSRPRFASPCRGSFFRLVFGAEARVRLDRRRQLALAGEVIDQHLVQLGRGPLEGGAQVRLALRQSPQQLGVALQRGLQAEPGTVG